MNSPITFPVPEPTLRLARPSAEKWAATLTEERRRLQDDHEELRQREQNLRDYESRLRALQAEIEAGRPGPALRSSAVASRSPLPGFARTSSQSPFNHEDPALQAAWEKLHRTREILEAEQKNLRDDRIAAREQETLLKLREDAVAVREQKLVEREALVVSALVGQSIPGEPPRSAMTKITRAPFDMARSVFGGKK